jgi:hypothetical protein
VLNEKFVKNVVNLELDPRIVSARAMNTHLLLHVEGVGLQEYLTRINSYENELQYEARKKHAISNKFVSEELLRPIDNIFTAKGGSKYYRFTTGQESKEKDFRLKLSNVKSGQSLAEYIETEWRNRFITDPNGLIFCEIEQETETGEEPNIYPCYKSIQKIRAYEQNGMNVDWVIFEPHKIEEVENDKETKKIEYFWAVDEAYYYEYRKEDGEILEVQAIENTFGYVPAILCSNINDPITGWKRSPIDAQIELLDRYVLSNSVLTITEFNHNYPNEWEVVPACSSCSGTGTLDNGDECSRCNGSGRYTKKDVTDKTLIREPIPGETLGIPTPPNGFSFLPTEPWELMVSSIDRYFDLIINSHWGATKEKKDNETATGRWIDVQPVNNRLSKYSKSAQLAHNQLADIFGEYYYPETFDKSDITYGQRYLIETPDQIWKKYIEAKEKKAPVSTLDLLLTQYIESEFKENDVMYNYELRKINLEPFVHWEIGTVRGSETISFNDKLTKEYFNEWINTLSIKDVTTKNMEELRKLLLEYSLNKFNDGKQNEEVQQTLPEA